MKKFTLLLLFILIVTGPVLSQDKDNLYSGKYIPKKFITDLSKPTLVMLTATWCGPCTYMKKTVMKKLCVIQCLDSLNVLIIDIDKEDKEYTDNFSAIGYEGAIPYFAILDRNGEFLDYIIGRSEEDKFIEFLRKSFKNDNTNKK